MRLVSTRQETGDVHQRDDWDIVAVAEPYEASAFDGRVDVEAACQFGRLVRNHSHRASLHSPETADDVLGVVGHDLEEVSVVQQLRDDALHVVGGVWIAGDHVPQGAAGPVTVVG